MVPIHYWKTGTRMAIPMPRNWRMELIPIIPLSIPVGMLSWLIMKVRFLPRVQPVAGYPLERTNFRVLGITFLPRLLPMKM